MKTWFIVLIAIASIVNAQQPAEVASDKRAYEFAKREAQTQARLGRVGHWLGIAPGCRFAGVGSSGATNRPAHCSTTRYRLVARAFAIGANGKVYWSAQYR